MSISLGIGLKIGGNGGGTDWVAYWATRIPSLLTLIVDSDTQITLNWTNNGAEDYDEGIIERSTDSGVTYSELTTFTTGDSSKINNSLTANTEYYYRIRYKKGTEYSDYSNVAREVTYPTILLSQTGGVDDTAAFHDWLRGDTLTIVESEINNWNVRKGIVLANVSATAAANRPPLVRDGISFPGTPFRLISGVTDIYQPVTIYLVYKRTVTNANGQDISFNLSYLQDATTGTRAYAGTNSALLYLTKDYFYIVTIVFNGASSYFQIDDETPIESDFGTGRLYNILYGADKNYVAYSPGSVFKGGIYRRIVDDAAGKASIKSYLRKRFFPSFDSPKILFTSDGNGDNIDTGMYDALKDKGVNGTFYIPVDVAVGKGANWWTWAQLLNYSNNGMDIQCHSFTHLDERGLTQEQLIEELESVNAAFATNGLPYPWHHAYPFGYYNDNVKSWIAPYRRTARATGGTYTSYAGFLKQFKDLDKYVIRSECIDYTDDTSLAELKLKMDIVAAGKSVMTLFTHGVNDTGASAITRAYFDAILDYAILIGMEPITISQLYALLD